MAVTIVYIADENSQDWEHLYQLELCKKKKKYFTDNNYINNILISSISNNQTL